MYVLLENAKYCIQIMTVKYFWTTILKLLLLLLKFKNLVPENAEQSIYNGYLELKLDTRVIKLLASSSNRSLPCTIAYIRIRTYLQLSSLLKQVVYIEYLIIKV